MTHTHEHLHYDINNKSAHIHIWFGDMLYGVSIRLRLDVICLEASIIAVRIYTVIKTFVIYHHSYTF